MSCNAAIALLESEILALGQGRKTQPDPCTTDWYLIRGKALALSFLRQLDASGFADDPQVVEKLYKAALKEQKQGAASGK